MNFEINNKNLLKFVLPCIMTMVFTSIFVMSDGVIVSNFINETALAAVNIVFPVTSLFLAVGLMFGSGISAICSKLMGEGRQKEANEAMSLIVVVTIILGIIFTILVQLNLDNILDFLGTSEDTYDYAYSFLRILSIFSGVLMLQMVFQSVMVVSGKAFLYFKTMICSGVIKVLTSLLLVAYFDLGMIGLAVACIIGYFIPVIVSLIALRRNSDLKLVKPSMNKTTLLNACANGSSEMVTNLASALTTFLFNYSMLKLVGDAGVSAITIILYIQFLLTSIFMGYSLGVAPVIGFNFGKRDSSNLRMIFKISIRNILIVSSISLLIGVLFTNGLSSLFATPGTEVFNLASDGLRLYAISFVFMGINIFASGMFTAYSNGKISAFISALRTLVLISTLLLVLPMFMGVTGVFIAVPIAEALTVIVSIILFYKYKNVYMYGNDVASLDINKSKYVNITVNRMFGSGGKEIAKRLSDSLGYSFYDEDIINDVINEQGITDEYLEKYSDINFNKNYDYKFATSFVKYGNNLVDDVYLKHEKVIKELSSLGNGIYVGNCADYILKDVVDFKIFIYASDEKFIYDRLLEKNKNDKKNKSSMMKMVNKINKSRLEYYKYYSGKDMDDATNYDLVIDVSKIGIKEAVLLIENTIKNTRK